MASLSIAGTRLIKQYDYIGHRRKHTSVFQQFELNTTFKKKTRSRIPLPVLHANQQTD
jgi:hypothetical protein